MVSSFSFSSIFSLKKDMLTASSIDMQGTVTSKAIAIALRELTAPKSKMEIISMATCLLEVSKVLGRGIKLYVREDVLELL